MSWPFFAANPLTTDPCAIGNSIRNLPTDTSTGEMPVLGRDSPIHSLCWFFAFWVIGCWSLSLRAQDLPTKSAPASKSYVEAHYNHEGTASSVRGELIANRPDYGQLVLDADGVLTPINPDELTSLTTIEGTLTPSTHQDLGQRMLAKMPAGSKFLTSEHFVICYNTTDTYARWNLNLYEKLFKGFVRFWKSKKVDVTPPRFPLVAMVFENKADYVAYASNDFVGSEHTFGYYHQGTNRLASYDLTGIEGLLPNGAKVNQETLLVNILSRPEAERSVATIVHEACHQIAFNTGLQTRLGNNPLWLSEGIALYFESPDLTNQAGWGGIGKKNQHNFRNLMSYLPVRPENSLEQLITQDKRFRDTETASYAYAESWGLAHLLIQTRPKEFVSYLNTLKSSEPGTQVDSRKRLEDFQSAFGEDFKKIDRDLIRHTQRIR
jgi:hypothetical protein